MKLLPFFFAPLLIISCVVKNSNDTKTTLTDTIVPAMDTAYVAVRYDPREDSISIKHQRDSFYAIKPAYLFTNTGKGSGFDQLIATAIDTGAVMQATANFTEKYSSTYNRDSMPITRTIQYSSSNYNVRVVDEEPGGYKQKKIFINGKRLRWGTDIDTSLTGSDISYWLRLYGEDCKLLQFKQKQWLLLGGGIEQCNGNACGVSYYLLFDPALKKAIAVQQFRLNYLYLGACGNQQQLAILVFDDYDHNYLFNNFTVAAKTYFFSNAGKIVPAKDKKSHQYFFDGYSIDDPDSIAILKANFPAK